MEHAIVKASRVWHSPTDVIGAPPQTFHRCPVVAGSTSTRCCSPKPMAPIAALMSILVWISFPAFVSSLAPAVAALVLLLPSLKFVMRSALIVVTWSPRTTSRRLRSSYRLATNLFAGDKFCTSERTLLLVFVVAIRSFLLTLVGSTLPLRLGWPFLDTNGIFIRAVLFAIIVRRGYYQGAQRKSLGQFIQLFGMLNSC